MLGFASTPGEIVELLARRRYELGMTSRAVETVAGLADEHVGTIKCVAKSLGHIRFPTLLTAYESRLAVLENEAGLRARMRVCAGAARQSFARQRNLARPAPGLEENRKSNRCLVPLPRLRPRKTSGRHENFFALENISGP